MLRDRFHWSSCKLTVIQNGWLSEFLKKLQDKLNILRGLQAPKSRDLNPSGLGRAIINKKVKDARQQQQSGLVSKLSYLTLSRNPELKFESLQQIRTRILGSNL
jgi:hypothetical protein